MSKPEARTSIDSVVENLRSIVLSKPEGELVGSENAMMAEMGCSRHTIRQVARLLEREGLLRVKRGINGGYFSARPDANTIEETVASYLATIDMDDQDITIIASALWVEAVRKAASNSPEAEAQLSALRKKVEKVRETATFDEIRALEMATQSKIFELGNSNYIKLIFDINVAFSRRRFNEPDVDDSSEFQSAFVKSWRNAKLLEFSAIESGDRELAVLSARHSRKIWAQRIRSRYQQVHTSPEI
ncbi:MAG: GntR family transcriptional regulator [Pigmentiphaga sp.]